MAARRTRWDRLAALVDRAARRGVRSLSPDEIDELALAYRAATSDPSSLGRVAMRALPAAQEG